MVNTVAILNTGHSLVNTVTILTCDWSQDGLVKWWDIRNFGRSFREFVVTAGDGQEGGGGVGGDGVSCMGYEATIPRYRQW